MSSRIHCRDRRDGRVALRCAAVSLDDFGGSVPYGGLGIECTLAWITGEKHIRQRIPFPGMMDKVYT